MQILNLVTNSDTNKSLKKKKLKPITYNKNL